MKKKLKSKDVKKDFLFNLYAVVDNQHFDLSQPINLTTIPKFYTVSYNKQNCDEYINCKEIDDNEEHYQQWCQLRNYNSELEEVWEEYRNTVLKESIYSIIVFHVYFSDILGLVRILEQCKPVGCSFDREIEYTYWLAKGQLTENLKEMFEELKEETIVQ